MTRCLPLLLCLLLPPAHAQTLVDRARADQVIMVHESDKAMNAAFARAQASLDEFLRDALARAPRNGNHALKVRVSDRNGTEYFWVTELQRLGTGFRGRLDNEPRLVKHVRAGQHYGFRRSEIVDWLYIDPSGRMHGNYTTCVLLKREKPDEAQVLAAQLRLRCD